MRWLIGDTPLLHYSITPLLLGSSAPSIWYS
jgi:hypothetical protein